MKNWKNEKYTSIAVYAFLVLLAALLLVFLLFNLGTVFAFLDFIFSASRSVILGALIALAIFPMAAKLEKFLSCKIFRKKERPRAARIAATSLSFAVILVALAVIVVSVIPMLNQNYQELSNNFSSYVNNLVTLLQSNRLIYNAFLSYTGLTGESAYELIASFVEHYSGLFQNFASGIFSTLFSLTTIISDIVIALILAFYFLLARDLIGSLLRKLSVALLPRRARRELARFGTRLYTDFTEFISARVVCSLALGVLCYLLTWALGVQFFPIISLFAMILNIIPVVGPIVSLFVCSLIVFLVQPQATWIFVIILLAVNLLEHLLVERYLLSRRLRLNTALTLVAVIVAYHYAGIIGTIVAVPFFVTLRTEITVLLNRRLRKKGYSTATEDYMTPLPPEKPLPAPETASEETAPSVTESGNDME